MALGLATLVFAACGGNADEGDGLGGGATSDGAASAITRNDAVDAGATTLLRRVTLFDQDPLGLGGPAASILVPDQWSVQGGPLWRHEYANLASLQAVVASPDGFQGVEFFPTIPNIWQSGGIPFFAEGSNYLGHDVRAPILDTVAFLELLLLPAYRGALNPRIIAREPLPDVAAVHLANSLAGTQVLAERVLTEHAFNGVAIREEFTVVLSFTPNPGLPGGVQWRADQLFSIRAPAADFDAARPVLQAIAASVVIDLTWYAGYQFVLDLSLRNGLEAIRAAGQASRVIAEANARITDTIIEGYQQTQATNDRIFEAVSQTIRGVETYADPFGGGTLELPNGFSTAYASAEGSVILSNDPNFDPIRTFPQETWETLALQR